VGAAGRTAPPFGGDSHADGLRFRSFRSTASPRAPGIEVASAVAMPQIQRATHSTGGGIMKMLKAVALGVLVALLAVGTVASAGEIKGKVQAVDPAGKSITLDNGTTLMIPASAKVDKKALSPGAEVKASYEEKNGMKMVQSLQVTK
jgi:hypothetical protein